SPQEINIARQTAVEGLAAYKAGEYEKAMKLFEQAKALYPSANILRMDGYTHLALGHWEKALEALEAALASNVGPLDADDRKDVNEQMQKALAHFGSVTITSKVPGAEVSVDGGEYKKLPLEKPFRLLEGKHSFTARARDHVDDTDELNVPG